MKQIIIVRCLSTRDNQITQGGFLRARNVARLLKRKGYLPNRLIHCDSVSQQSVMIIAAAMGHLSVIKSEETLDFFPAYEQNLIEEFHFLSRNNISVKDALEKNEHVRRNQERIVRVIKSLAKAMAEEKQQTALVVSYPFYAELAAVVENSLEHDTRDIVPFGVTEGTCLVYSVDEKQGKITNYRVLNEFFS